MQVPWTAKRSNQSILKEISPGMDWLDLLAVQGTLKSFFPTPQFRSINSLVLSFLYSPTLTSIHDHWKNHSLDETDLIGQVMSLLFNMLCRLVIKMTRTKKEIFLGKLTISWGICSRKRTEGQGLGTFLYLCDSQGPVEARHSNTI